MNDKVKYSTNEKDYKEYGLKIAPDLISKSAEYQDLDEAINDLKQSEYADKI